MSQPPPTARRCLLEPVAEIAEAARLLDAAVTAHQQGNGELAEKLIREADLEVIRDWTESLWGKASPHLHFRSVPNSPPLLSAAERIKLRMPTLMEQQQLRRRDGYHCRFCGIPVIRREVRQAMQKAYPEALPWGKRNPEQHAAFQAMWLQYDHLLPHARGGDNALDNLVITCAPCNFARMNHTLAELGLQHPFERPAKSSDWEGLERFLKRSPNGGVQAGA